MWVKFDCGQRFLGLRLVSQQSLLDMLSAKDEDDTISSDEEDEHNASCWGMRVDSFLEDEEPLRGQLWAVIFPWISSAR